MLAERDTEFHRTLAEMTHNPLLLVLMDSIRELLREYIALVTVYLDPLEDNIRLHEMLLERIEARDREGAQAAMQANLDQMQHNTELYTRLTHPDGEHGECNMKALVKERPGPGLSLLDIDIPEVEQRR